jgi:hypothetical protein
MIIQGGLNWLCSAMTSWRHCFESVDYLQGENLYFWSGDGRACALFSSWRRHFWRFWSLGVVLVVIVSLLLGLEYRSGFYFFSFFSFLWMCVSVLPLRYCIVADAGCNWYLLILINSLYQKTKTHFCECHIMIIHSKIHGCSMKESQTP